MLKLDMWLTNNQYFPHSGQDTNAAIESYHGNMKAILRASKGRFVRCRIDLLIHKLTHDVIMKDKFNQYLKESGFNKIRRPSVSSSTPSCSP